MRALADITDAHHSAVTERGFEWLKEGELKLQACPVYSNAVRRASFAMLRDGATRGNKDKYKYGDHVMVDAPSKSGQGRGEAYAPSIARIVGIYQDQQGCCHVALWYYWRWGQINAAADLHPRFRSKYRAQIWLQEEHVEKPKHIQDGGNPVRYDDGCFREVVPAGLILRRVPVVLGKDQVETHYGSLEAFEEAFPNKDEQTGTRDNGFWCDFTFDHTAYVFKSVQLAGPGDGPEPIMRPLKLLDPGRAMSMGDAFCGLGTLSVFANMVGWQVEFGIDSSPAAISSFRANAGSSGSPFNPVTHCPPVGICRKLEQVVAQLKEDKAAGRPPSVPQVHLLHLSPPCQNVSSKKHLHQRKFSGSVLLSAMELVQLLLPFFVTLEEVGGFVHTKFMPDNLSGVLAGYPNSPPTTATAAADHSRAGCGQDSAGEDDDEGSEGAADLDELEASDDCDGDEPEAAQAGVIRRNGSVSINPVLMVVPQLLDMGYQVRLCLLNAAYYGAPEKRWRVVLFAAKRGYQLPQPPAPRYSPAPDEQGRFKLLPRINGFITDPGFILRLFDDRESVAGDWQDALCVEPDTPQLLPPCITLQEAIGDLPPLLGNPQHIHHRADAQLTGAARGGLVAEAAVPSQQPAAAAAVVQRQATVLLGEEMMEYKPDAGIMNCPLPLDGCRPVSRYSRYMRSPHAAHQDASLFRTGMLEDHTARHSSSAVLTALRKDSRQQQEGETQPRKDKRANRPAADGLAGTVLGHNEPRPACLHFKEDRFTTLLERRRVQSLPDWLCIKGDSRDREQQVGNAVPGLLAAEIMAAVWEAATGQPARRPPLLNGPCQEGVGISDPLARAQYFIWLQQQGWQGVLQASRASLEQEARQLQAQQQQQLELLVGQQLQQQGEGRAGSSALCASQQQQQQQQQQRRKRQETQAQAQERQVADGRKQPRHSLNQDCPAAAATALCGDDL